MIMERKDGKMGAESVLRRMERMMSGETKEKGRQRQAQQLVYDAWEAADADEAYDLLAQAAELDPTNVDAQLGLMDFEPMENDEQITRLRQLAAMGEKNLGKNVFKEDKGHFWGLLETRT